jgi:hypothetical protein
MTRTRVNQRQYSRTIAQEAELGVVLEDYVWKLSPFLLPNRDGLSFTERCELIRTAREHEADMWRTYPEGPESLQ